MRHSFDGGFAHFLVDAGRFAYPQFHSPCKVTNQGFAFNEGWAEYWARTPQTCSDRTNFSQEGNVAAALTGLERCTSRPQMVRVLRESPTGLTLSSGIHSLSDFRTRFFELYGQRVCNTPRLDSALTDAVISQAQVRSNIRSQISAQRGLIGTLATQERQARTAAQTIEPCRGAGCEDAMQRVIAPAALDAQGRQATLVLARLRQALATARRARFRTFHRSRFVDALARRQRRVHAGNETIVIAGLRRAIEAIGDRPAIRGEGSTSLLRTLRRRLAPSFGRRGGDPAPRGPAQAVRAAGPAARGRHAGARRAAASAARRRTSHHAVADVPAVVNTATGPPFTVTGTLAPAPSAATIRLVYTPPGGTPFARTTMADGTGGWSHTIDPQTDHGDGNTFGNWTAQSHFDGAPGFPPSQSSTCTVTVTD